MLEGHIPGRSRLTIAALVAALAVPVGAGSCGILLVRGIGTDGLRSNANPWLMGFAILMLGWIWIYETGSRLTGEKIDGRPFSMAAVAVGAMLGLMGGLAVIVAGVPFALLAPVTGALLVPSPGRTLGTDQRDGALQNRTGRQRRTTCAGSL